MTGEMKWNVKQINCFICDTWPWEHDHWHNLTRYHIWGLECYNNVTHLTYVHIQIFFPMSKEWKLHCSQSKHVGKSVKLGGVLLCTSFHTTFSVRSGINLKTREGKILPSCYLTCPFDQGTQSLASRENEPFLSCSGLPERQEIYIYIHRHGASLLHPVFLPDIYIPQRCSATPFRVSTAVTPLQSSWRPWFWHSSSFLVPWCAALPRRKVSTCTIDIANASQVRWMLLCP
jgi:hypothetical protein